MTELLKEYEYVLSALSDKSGEDIEAMDLSGLGGLADVFILVTGNSEVHMKTLMDAAEEALERHGQPCRREGETSANWRLLDAGHVIVHIFSHKGRDFYKLDKLWADAETERYEEAEGTGGLP
ncbi:MAG: ribosome silencing factor [Fretibacterium sp.]|nr:ribosome silencing factor [Fretibacterium sp.]